MRFFTPTIGKKSARFIPTIGKEPAGFTITIGKEPTPFILTIGKEEKKEGKLTLSFLIYQITEQPDISYRSSELPVLL